MSKKKKEATVEVEEKTAQQTQDTAAPETEQTAPETYVLTAEEMKTARERIESLQREKEETVALLQRNQADFDNYRRRNAAVRTDSLEEGRRECIKSLLPVLDNFDRAMENGSAEDSSWHEGVKLVHRQLLETLQKMGMSEIDTTGKFDPNLHEAVMQEAVDGKESGAIIAVFQKGYRVGDRIIRHSMVKVAE